MAASRDHFETRSGRGTGRSPSGSGPGQNTSCRESTIFRGGHGGGHLSGEELYAAEEGDFPRRPAHAARRRAESSDVGQALEEVIRLAEDLQEEMLPQGSVRLDAPPGPQPCEQRAGRESAAADAERAAQGGVLSRLFQWQQERRRQRRDGTDSGLKASEAPWRDYAREFQEV